MDAVKRLGGSQARMPDFVGKKIASVKQNLEDEIRLLGIMMEEVAAREERVVFLKDVLTSVDNGDLEPVFG